MKILLRLKHWQMFLILFLPFIFTDDTTVGQIVQIVWFIIYFGWVYTIGIALHERLPDGHGINPTYFKISFFYIIFYLSVITFLFKGGYSINQDNYKEYGNSVWVIIPLHTYLMWSILYFFYFAAKMLVSIIEGKVVGIEKSIGYFFAFFFFPIGVWYIQPKVQKIITT